MKKNSLCRLGALLLAVCALTALGIGSALADTPVSQVTFHIELIKTTAGDVTKSSMPFDFTPFAPAVTGSFPSNLSAKAGNDEGSLATVQGDGAGMFLKYLHSHGKTLSKPAIQTVDGVPATISFTEPIQGPVGGVIDGAFRYSNSLSTKIEVSPKAQPDGSIDYNLSLDLIGGKKQSGATMISQETIKIEHQGPGGETFAFGGYATMDSVAAGGVPLLTDGLSSDDGFRTADPKTPVLFVFVTVVLGTAK